VTFPVLEKEKEEEKGVKGQAQRQKPRDDKPAFRKEEVNVFKNNHILKPRGKQQAWI
jgi:hypothetical protein